MVALRALIANPLTTESDIDEVPRPVGNCVESLTRNPQITPRLHPTTYGRQ